MVHMNGNTDYASVIYPAKSLLEFADAERAARRKQRLDLKHQLTAPSIVSPPSTVIWETGRR